MKRLIIAAFVGSWSMAGVVLAQPLPGTTGRGDAPPVRSVAVPDWNNAEPATPPLPLAPQALPSTVSPGAPQSLPPTGSPGETQESPESRAHQLHLMQTHAAEESVHQAAVARAEQRTRRLESQRWYGVSNKRPTANVDPYDGDYSAYWASNYPYYPLRWVGGGESWGFVQTQP